MRRRQHPTGNTEQRGAALMVMMVIMIVGGAIFLVNSLSSSALNTVRQENSAAALAQAKEALIGYAFLTPGVVRRPGNLPYQDRLVPAPEEAATTDGHPNYNGYEDGCPVALPTCLGRLPWRDLGMSISGSSENDPSGIMPWYAFSRNLEQGQAQPINPALLNTATSPWLTVRDMSGNILSNRVAFIVIIPGSVLPGQSRPVASITPPISLGGPEQYLDSITVPADCHAPCVPGTYNNSDIDLDDDFIMGDEHRWIADPNNPNKQIKDTSYFFNDKLIYVTIDELIPEIIKRVAGEARSLLNDYYAVKNMYPDAALLGSSGTSVLSNDSGMLPTSLGTCACSSFTSCGCSFNLVASAAFKRGGSSTWSATNVSGACTRTSTQVCTCTGAGYCKNSSGTRNFTCNSSGNCTHNASSGKYIFTPPSYGTISSPLGGCSLNGNNAECNGSGSIAINLNFPGWFSENLWQDYFYYHKSSTASLQAGTQESIKALVIGVGAPIISTPFASKGSAQLRPSSNINEYLDSTENTNGDLLFEAATKPSSNSYNDQIFILAP